MPGLNSVPVAYQKAAAHSWNAKQHGHAALGMTLPPLPLGCCGPEPAGSWAGGCLCRQLLCLPTAARAARPKRLAGVKLRLVSSPSPVPCTQPCRLCPAPCWPRELLGRQNGLCPGLRSRQADGQPSPASASAGAAFCGTGSLAPGCCHSKHFPLLPSSSAGISSGLGKVWSWKDFV